MMQIQSSPNYNKPAFRGGGFSELMMSNVFLNKTLFDLTGSDIPWVFMANNNSERRERINRSALSIGMIFISPLIVLPLANRFAMKYVAKLTPKLFSENYNALRLSNKYLTDAKSTEEGIKSLAKTPIVSTVPKLLNIKSLQGKEQKIDLNELLKQTNGSYDELRKRLIKAKNFVLCTDLLLIAGSFGQVGFYNNRQTEEKTGQIGYSAELKMADKEIIENRAKKFKKSEKLRYLTYLTGLASLGFGLPLMIRHGLLSKKTDGISGFVKKHCAKFDYHDAIFTSRLPLALSLTCANFGIFMASRNNTERKDNILRSSTGLSIFFLGDLLLTSIGGRISDKFFKTQTMKKPEKETFWNKLLPPMKSVDELKATNCPKTLKNAKIAFWTNFTILSATMGLLTPYLINKIIKKDVSDDVKKAKATN